MLAVMRKIYCYVGNESKPELTTSSCGKMLLVLGAGRIGSCIGKLAKALGMKVVFWKRGDRLETLLKDADVVYCALPLSDETKGLVGEKEFVAMKQGTYFVTTSHYQIYDNAALMRALDRNLAGAAIDLEGINCGDYKSEIWQKLKSHPKILLTPHVAFKSDYGQRRAYDIMIDNIEAFVNGNPQNVVN
jgi:glycerate dehydrogenase